MSVYLRHYYYASIPLVPKHILTYILLNGLCKAASCRINVVIAIKTRYKVNCGDAIHYSHYNIFILLIDFHVFVFEYFDTVLYKEKVH